MAAPFTAATRRFIATLVAAVTALALMTAAAVPARAESEDNIARLRLSPAGIAIIGTATTQNRDGDRYRDRHGDHRPPVVAPVHQPRYGHGNQRHRRDDRHDNRRVRSLPAECAIQVQGRRHSTVAYTEHCLRRNGIAHRLPQYCATEVRMRGRRVTAYAQGCLLEAGFSVAGRRRY